MNKNSPSPASRFPSRIRGLVTTGLTVSLLGAGGFIGWAATVPLESAVVAPGTVKAGTENKRIQHLEGGIIKHVLVREGDTVRQGQTLLVLEETFAETEVSILSQQRLELQIQAEVLSAEVEELAVDVLQQRLAELPENSLPQQQEALRQFRLNRESKNNQVAMLEQQRAQLQEQIQGMQAELEARGQQLRFTRDELESWRSLVEKKITSKSRYLELERDAAELSGTIAQLKTGIAALKTRQSELGLEMLQVRQDYRYAAAASLREVRAKLDDIRQRAAASEDILNRLAVKSPADGIVVGLQFHSPGEVIRPGEQLLEIVPSQDEMIINARVALIDVDQVAVAQQARVRLSAYKRYEVPELAGVVTSVSADALYDEKSDRSYYEARISLSSVPQSLPRAIQPGMPAEVYISTGQSTPLQYLAEPLLNAFDRAWRED